MRTRKIRTISSEQVKKGCMEYLDIANAELDALYNFNEGEPPVYNGTSWDGVTLSGFEALEDKIRSSMRDFEGCLDLLEGKSVWPDEIMTNLYDEEVEIFDFEVYVAAQNRGENTCVWYRTYSDAVRACERAGFRF